MYRKEYDINFVIMDLFLLLYGLEALFPPITVIFNSTLVSLISIFAVVLIMFITDSPYFLTQPLKNTYPLIFFLATAVFPYLFGIGVIGNRYLSLCMIPFGYLIFNFYKKYNRLHELKIVCVILSLFAAVTFLMTLKALIADPYISRSIKSSGEYSSGLAKRGIGGYQFIYFIVIAGQFLLYIFLQSKSKLIKFCTLLLFLVSLFFVLKSNYMTALLTALIASGVMLISKYSGKGIVNKIMLIAVIAAVILFVANIDALIKEFSDFIPKRILKVVGNSENGTMQAIMDEFLDDRFPVMRESIVEALKHPLLGLISSDAMSVGSDGILVGFGQHSHILDTFALYGLPIGALNIFVILKPFYGTDGKKIKYGKPLNGSMAVCVVGIYLFNNATPSVAFGFCLMYPLIRELYKPKEVENNCCHEL